MATNKYEPSYEITGKDSNGTPTTSDEVEPGTGITQAGLAKITKVSSIVTVLVAGLALFSDGYNAQIIG